jgi:hypothetical protein
MVRASRKKLSRIASIFDFLDRRWPFIALRPRPARSNDWNDLFVVLPPITLDAEKQLKRSEAHRRALR